MLARSPDDRVSDGVASPVQYATYTPSPHTHEYSPSAFNCSARSMYFTAFCCDSTGMIFCWTSRSTSSAACCTRVYAATRTQGNKPSKNIWLLHDFCSCRRRRLFEHISPVFPSWHMMCLLFVARLHYSFMGQHSCHKHNCEKA